MTSQQKERIGWYFYDWANSSYPLVINTAIFPIYYSIVTRTGTNDNVEIFGMQFYNSALYSYVIAISFACVSLLTPLLSGIADYSGRKRFFLKMFCTIGSLSCAGLYFFTRDNLVFGLALVMLASIGFSGSLVFYNAFLPEIASIDEQDNVSARGYSMGYFGSSLLLILNIVMINNPTSFGFDTTGLTESQVFMRVAPITFIMVAVWWIGFAQLTFRWVHDRGRKEHVHDSMLTAGFREIRRVWQELRHQPRLKIFLAAFFANSMGVQTVILVSTFYGEQVIGMKESELITILLVLQFVAIAGSYLFSWLSKKTTNITALLLAIAIWISVCVSARFITSASEYWILSVFVGLVLGGIQSLSRSTYSKLLPETHDHASYFSFYDICEKIGIVIGMFSYGWIADITGSMRNSAIALTIFFLTGFLLLTRLRYVIQRSSINSEV